MNLPIGPATPADSNGGAPTGAQSPLAEDSTLEQMCWRIIALCGAYETAAASTQQTHRARRFAQLAQDILELISIVKDHNDVTHTA